MKIMTWNVNRFDGVTWNWYDKKEDLSIDKREKTAKEIIAKISKEVNTSNDIAILQEVPYCKYPYNKNVHEIDMWKDLFKERDLDLILPNIIKNVPLNVTIAITTRETDWKANSKNIIKFDDSGIDYSNAYIEVNTDRVRLLGIHLKNGALDLNYAIDELDEANRPDVIIGDFNAGDWGRTHYGKGLNREEYVKFKQRFGYTDVCGGRVTNHRNNTPIDHFLITNMIGYTYDILKICIDDEEERLSDHYPIIVEMNERNK